MPDAYTETSDPSLATTSTTVIPTAVEPWPYGALIVGEVTNEGFFVQASLAWGTNATWTAVEFFIHPDATQLKGHLNAPDAVANKPINGETLRPNFFFVGLLPNQSYYIIARARKTV
jgi:hypothetical protein